MSNFEYFFFNCTCLWKTTTNIRNLKFKVRHFQTYTYIKLQVSLLRWQLIWEFYLLHSWSQLVFDASTFIRTSWSLTFLEQDSHQQNQVHRHMQLQLGQRFFLLWQATKLLPQPCNPLHPGQKDKVVHSKDQLSLVQHLQPCVLNQWLLFPSRRYSLHQSVKKIVGKVIIGERFNIRRYLKAKVPHLVVYLAIYNLKVSKYLVHTIKVKIRVNLLLHVLENYKMFSNFFESFSLKIF